MVRYRPLRILRKHFPGREIVSMRYILVLLVGGLAGALIALSVLNALRPAQAFPRGVMAVMQHHLQGLNADIKAARCDAADPRLQTLARVARDIPPAFLPTGGDDALFRRYSEQLAARIDAALAAPAADCGQLTEQVGQIGDGCKACHRDFK